MAMNINAINSEYERVSEGGNGEYAKIEYFNIPKGDSYFHVLPRWDDHPDGLPYHEVGLHFMVDNEGKKRAYLCAHYSGESRCPLCEKSKRLQGSSDLEDKSTGKSIRCVKRFMYNAANKAGEIKVLNAGPQLHGELLYEFKEDLGAGFDPCSYDEGLMIKVTRTGTDWMDTKYKARAERARHKLPSELKDGHSSLPKLDKIHETYSVEELEQVLAGNYNPKNKAAKTSSDADSKTLSSSIETPIVKKTVKAPVVQEDDVEEELPPAPPVKKAPVKGAPGVDAARKLLGL